MSGSYRCGPGESYNVDRIITQLQGKSPGAQITTSLYFTNAPGVCHYVWLKAKIKVRAVSIDNGRSTRFIVTK